MPDLLWDVLAAVPELPEVEITRRKLAPALLHRRIEQVVTTAPSYFFVTPPGSLRKQLTGRTAIDLLRHGKYLLAELDDGSRLLLHLGMTGQLFAEGLENVRLLSATAGAALTPEELRTFTPDAHTHIRLRLAGEGGDVYFRDPRKFGKVQWLPPGQSCARLDKLGPDALGVTGATLYAAIHHRRAAIKGVLLDQGVLAGVGNIYADEALFRVRVSPRRQASRVSRKACDALAEALKAVMLRSIETGGSSISDYIQPDGERGRFQDERNVYGLTGSPCPSCKTPIRRVIIAGRSSHYCPRCQR